ncbi:MAG: ABC transporter ATP-binding protein [Desulfobacterales bacterium]|nr:MAG: ABC transporter ATP-binding protein [Desulfobacterales bacterium]
MLKVNKINKHFGGVQAICDCTLEVEKGTITGLIGPNGAGKTTLFNVITGFYKPGSGQIHFNDEDITGLQPYQIFRRGLFRTFQITREYKEMSVLENLLLIPKGQVGERLWNVWFKAKTIAEQEQENLDKAQEILEFLEMKSKKDMPAKHLPGGEKKLLELGRMMMVDLDMVLLDEPGAGIPPILQNKVLDYIKKMSRERGLTLFVVEHDMNVIMNLCDPIIVMTDGSVLTQGSPEEVRSDKRVIQAYLGQNPSEHHT